MRLVQGFAIAVFTLMGATLSFAQVGDVADYQVDLDRRRTTSYIRSGNLNTEVEMLNAGSGSDDSTYTTRIDYEFVIQFMGTRAGTRVLEVPAEFFTPEFKEELRTTGHYESEQFKIDHQGFADARTLDGNFYPNCDVIRIYDIKQTKAEWVTAMLAPAFYQDMIENMVIIAHVADGVPVLGAVKIDVSGTYQGMAVKAGGDYVAP